MKNGNYHTLSEAEVVTSLTTSESGLTDVEAAARLTQYGKNELKEGEHKSLLQKFFEQFKDFMVIVLLAAAIVSGILGEIADSVIIFLVVILNAALGVFQEAKAEKALDALKKMSSPHARVKRNGRVADIRADELVPGDIVLIEAGDYIPADMRLIEAASLKIEEAALTGESVPAEKGTAPLEKEDIVIGDRVNMAYLGSSVTYGRGIGVVTSTGMSTEVGKIAGYLTGGDPEITPLQRKLTELGKTLTIGVLIIAAVIFAAGIFQGRGYLDMFLTAVSLAVAAIPEGLPAIVTIVLAMGVQKMAKQNAIIRKLPAVETLGSTEIICSDKTGTLTQNKMTVKRLYSGNGWLEEQGTFKDSLEGERLMQIMSLCNDAKVDESGSGNGEEDAKLIGDPTETALVAYAKTQGYSKPEWEAKLPRKAEIPFDSDRKLMTTFHETEPGKYLVFVKGAPDVLAERCTQIAVQGRIEGFSSERKEQVHAANREMASEALRVLALAYRETETLPDNPKPEDWEKELTFVGLTGMIDPPREEVKAAVEVCRTAGIRPVMITGDHKDTASAIARELGILAPGDEAITGSELDRIPPDEFIQKVEQYSVYARVSPEHKVRIVKAWKEKGKVVAMTGDGVNDAPALKTADIGVGMGITGTDVSKGVSDMVLSDDNFSTIVVAVEEGRKVYSNIKKAIQYLLSANIGEVLTLFIATMFGAVILFPIHILWINLVTDTFPALALGVEKTEKGVMKRPPRPANASVFAEGAGWTILYQGILEAAIVLGVFFYALDRYSSPEAITMAFGTLGFIQVTHAFNVRSQRESIFKIGLFSNRYMLLAAAASTLLILIVMLVPFFQDIFSLTVLSWEQWSLIIGGALLIVVVVEIIKIFKKKEMVPPIV
ncbi:calcium-translocating P-type ATPase, SERCA-type [Gorillibacterium timonense]|uniref:calcium-translocating P-type ATPase, SERCA-type n=1 Tax=Gorillibacterium timonense TaxID=1689269 RepID=UPI00071DAD65|nr:calcium-translocating P-type ATPase, SERCA-type [Gorillibacterium timonense]